MAVPAKNSSTGRSPAEMTAPERDMVQEKAAELYGQGYRRSQVARILQDHLVKDMGQKTDKLKLARHRLRMWEKDQKFRDLIYARAVVEIDLETPQIIKGIVARAKDGRVDAARLALEVSGRHDPKGDSAPTQVVVAFGAIPRPALQTTEADEIEDGEAEEV